MNRWICVLVVLAGASLAHAGSDISPLAGSCPCDQEGQGSVCTTPGAECTDEEGKPGVCKTMMGGGIGGEKICVCKGKSAGGGGESSMGSAQIEPRPPRGCSEGEYVVTIVTDQPRSVVSTVPDEHGGEAVRSEELSGAVKVVVALEDGACRIRIISGEFTAPSITLPDGKATGENRYDVVGDESGTLDVEGATFDVRVRGTLRNDLYPDGIAVTSRYRGTVDFETSSLTFRTNASDEYASPKVPRPRGGGGCPGCASADRGSALVLAIAFVMLAVSGRRRSGGAARRRADRGP